MLERFINNLMDIPKVEGLVLFNRAGALLLQKMPSFFLDEALEQLGRRIVSMYETVDENFLQCDDYVLKFPGKHLLLRRGPSYFMFLLCSEEVNLLSLKMVTNMTFKHLTPEMLSAMGGGAVNGSAPAVNGAAVPAPAPVAAVNGAGYANGHAVNGAAHAPNGTAYPVNGAAHGVNGTAAMKPTPINGHSLGARAGSHAPFPPAPPRMEAPVPPAMSSASRAPFPSAPPPPPMAAVQPAPEPEAQPEEHIEGPKGRIIRPERPNRTYRGGTY